MNTQQSRRPRHAVEMRLRSTGLPGYGAVIVNMSTSGARLRLKGRVQEGSLVEQRIRFGAWPAGAQAPRFEGFARVAWVKAVGDEMEAGIEWEHLAPGAHDMIRASLPAA